MSPAQITPSGKINPENINGVRQTILNYYKPKFKNSFGTENIYISRSKAKYRKVLNEEELIPVLKKYDFKIIRFEEMPFSEQVECCYYARNIVSIHGANLTNSLFMQSGGNVMELRKNRDNYNNYFYAIVDSVNCNYYYMESLATDQPELSNFFDLTVDPVAFELNLKRMLNKEL